MNLRSKWDYLDQDYVDKLTDEEKQFLSNFNEEFYGGYFTHSGKKLHRTKKERRECYGRNNSRNRDVFALMRATNQLDQLNPPGIDPSKNDVSAPKNPSSHEEMVLDLLDLGVLTLED